MVARISARQRQQEAYAYLGIAQSEYDASHPNTGQTNVNLTKDGSVFNMSPESMLKSVVPTDAKGILKNLAKLLTSNEAGREDLDDDTRTNTNQERKNSAKAERYKGKLLQNVEKYSKKLLELGYTQEQINGFIQEQKDKANQASGAAQNDAQQVDENMQVVEIAQGNINKDQQELLSLQGGNAYVSKNNNPTVTLSGDNSQSNGLLHWEPQSTIEGQGSDIPAYASGDNDDLRSRIQVITNDMAENQQDIDDAQSENADLADDMNDQADVVTDIRTDIDAEIDEFETCEDEIVEVETDATGDYNDVGTNTTEGGTSSTVVVTNAGSNTGSAAGNITLGTKQEAAAAAASTNLATVSKAPQLSAEGAANIANGGKNAPINISGGILGMKDMLQFATTFTENIVSFGSQMASVTNVQSTLSENAGAAVDVQEENEETQDLINTTLAGIGTDRNDHELLHSK